MRAATGKPLFHGITCHGYDSWKYYTPVSYTHLHGMLFLIGQSVFHMYYEQHDLTTYETRMRIPLALSLIHISVLSV